MKSKVVLLILLLIGFVVKTNAQTITHKALSSGASKFDNASLHVTSSTGIVFGTSLSAGNLLLTQGFQQGVWKYFKDQDGDTYGNRDSAVYDFAQPLGYVLDSSDCNDFDSTIHSVTHTTSLNICRRDSTLWNGQYYKSTSSDSVHLVSYTGCDSVDILNLNVYPLYYTVITQYFCKGHSMVFNGQTITTAGTYYYHYTSATGCDSTVRLRALYRAAIPITYLSLPICVGGSVQYGGQTFTAPGVYKVTLQGYSACDSVVQLTLLKRTKTYAKVTIYRCPNDSILYHNVYYKANGVHTVIIPNRFGCDSVITLLVLTSPTSYSVVTQYICQGDSTLYHGVYYKQTGTYFIHLTNRYGCDSTVRLRLLYNNSSSLTTVTLCQAQTYTWNGTTYTWGMAGTYVRHFVNYKRCDSVATLKVYRGNCKLEGIAESSTITTTETFEESASPEAPIKNELVATHNFEMSIYPNPNTGKFILENNCTSCKQMHVEIFTIDGKLMYSTDADNTSGKINIDVQLASGMYWVKMSNGNEGYSEMKRFVINN
jgi:hypothetical protein